MCLWMKISASGSKFRTLPNVDEVPLNLTSLSNSKIYLTQPGIILFVVQNIFAIAWILCLTLFPAYYKIFRVFFRGSFHVTTLHVRWQLTPHKYPMICAHQVTTSNSKPTVEVCRVHPPDAIFTRFNKIEGLVMMISSNT